MTARVVYPTYPNVIVIAEPVVIQDNRRDTVTNPLLIAEVLSDSSSAYDRGDKFAAYRIIPTFQEYLVIDQALREAICEASGASMALS